ncbi:MAG TPA: hypothetical protein DEP23_00820 [Ruminococcaceae bacterium]|nr:hypothetical protein [Oscillospiraceae bacterium]
MNFFNDFTSITGDAQSSYSNETLTEFFEQAELIREKAGKRAYLLDKYLSILLTAINTKLAQDAASDGFDTAGQLIGVCASVVRGEPEKADHWFFKKAKEYIELNPLDFQEKHTQVNLYFVLLFINFMNEAVSSYIDNLEYECRAVMDVCDLKDLFDGICSVLGEEEPMEKLNCLFRQQFLLVNAMTTFWQGASNQLTYCLAFRDRETSKQIFQLLPEGYNRK